MEHVLLSHFLSELPQLWSLDNLLVLILLIEFHQLLESTLPCTHGNGDLQGLIVELISAQEYVDGDSELLTCDGRWEEVFMSNLGKPNEETQVDEEAEDNSRSESPPIPKIISYKEAIIALEDVQSLKAGRGHASTSFTYVGPAVDAISSLNVTCMCQRSLHDYCS